MDIVLRLLLDELGEILERSLSEHDEPLLQRASAR